MPPRQASFSASSAAGPSNSGSRGGAASRNRRSSQIKETDLKRIESKAEGLEVEEFGPPKWRTVLNSRADLGMSFRLRRGWSYTLPSGAYTRGLYQKGR